MLKGSKGSDLRPDAPSKSQLDPMPTSPGRAKRKVRKKVTFIASKLLREPHASSMRDNGWKIGGYRVALTFCVACRSRDASVASTERRGKAWPRVFDGSLVGGRGRKCCMAATIQSRCVLRTWRTALMLLLNGTSLLPPRRGSFSWTRRGRQRLATFPKACMYRSRCGQLLCMACSRLGVPCLKGGIS